MFAPGFVAKIIAVVDPSLRLNLAAQELTHMAPPAAAREVADAIRASVAARDPKAQAALLAIVGALGANKLEYATLQRLYQAGQTLGYQAVARIFLDPHRGGGVAPAPERALRPNDRPLTLGERKSLARTKNRDLLALLARDPHPDVVAILLGNPQVTERDVVRIAAHRPGIPAALRAIAEHPRWLAARHVRLALVHNPATELGLAIRIIATLLRGDIETIVHNEALHSEIIAQARLTLALADASSTALVDAPLVN